MIMVEKWKIFLLVIIIRLMSDTTGYIISFVSACCKLEKGHSLKGIFLFDRFKAYTAKQGIYLPISFSAFQKFLRNAYPSVWQDIYYSQHIEDVDPLVNHHNRLVNEMKKLSGPYYISKPFGKPFRDYFSLVPERAKVSAMTVSELEMYYKWLTCMEYTGERLLEGMDDSGSSGELIYNDLSEMILCYSDLAGIIDDLIRKKTGKKMQAGIEQPMDSSLHAIKYLQQSGLTLNVVVTES